MTELDRIREMPARQIAGYLVYPVERIEYDYNLDDELEECGTFTEYTSEFITESYGTYKEAYSAVVEFLNSQF